MAVTASDVFRILKLEEIKEIPTMAETRTGNLQAISQKAAPSGGFRWSVMVAGDWAGAFTNKMTPETQALLASLKKGDPVEIQVEKNKNGYWELVGIRKTSYEQASNPQPPDPPAQVLDPNYVAPAPHYQAKESPQDKKETMVLSYSKDIVNAVLARIPFGSMSPEEEAEAVARATSLVLTTHKTLMENRQN